MDTAIAIRTAVINGFLHIQAGAGIAADPSPRHTTTETLPADKTSSSRPTLDRGVDGGDG